MSDVRLTVRIITLFPDLFDSWLSRGVVARAVSKNVVAVELVHLRDFGVGRHQVTDDYPFGGGAGMVLKPEPLFDAVEALHIAPDVPVILLSPRGERFSQELARQLAELSSFVLVSGHYEGVDERVRQHLITHEVSIGDYVISCGELAAMIVTDAVVRLVPGSLSEGATVEESFSNGVLEYPQYTRPAVYRSWQTPDVLLSGNHEAVARWRREQALRITFLKRADLLDQAELTDAERFLIGTWKAELLDTEPAQLRHDDV